jgi:hypothetical protein
MNRLYVLHAVRRAVPIALTLLTLLTALTALGSTYIGNGSSPYDTCIGANGRPVSCAALEANASRWR